MPFNIPIQDNAPFFDQTTELDGTEFTFTFKYNQREARFYMSLALTDGTSVIEGIALVCRWPLGINQRTALTPPGLLMCVPSGPDDSPPALGELGPGKRVELWYYTALELVS